MTWSVVSDLRTDPMSNLTIASSGFELDCSRASRWSRACPASTFPGASSEASKKLQNAELRAASNS